MNRTVKLAFASAVLIVVVLATFVGGFVVGHNLDTTDTLGAPTASTDMVDVLNDVYGMLQDQALEPPSETTATAGIINGLLRSNGDRYARYIPPAEFKNWQEETAGVFGGIGVVLGEKDGTVYVVEVYAGTPAARAGLKSGDYFFGVDGEENESWSIEGIQKRVKGEPGTDVKLTMLRPWPKNEMPDDPFALGKKYTVTITRDTIQVPIVNSEMKPGKVGWVELTDFNERSTTELAAAIKDLESQGATSLILDLRNNPGGLLDQAVGVASLFIEKGTIVTVESRTADPEIYRATGQKVTDLPLIVLVNENSASASEIVSGALQDYNRGKLLGVQTFGKGSVQTQQPLANGGIAVFTIAHYITPKGQKINHVGLTPDIKVEMDVSLMEDPSKDTQLIRAIAEAKKL